MTDTTEVTTERDRLVELLAERFAAQDWFNATGSSERFVQAIHLADHLIANGWSRTVQRPEVDAEVEWGVRFGEEDDVDNFGAHEEAARLNATVSEYPLVRRSFTMGPWQEAQ